MNELLLPVAYYIAMLAGSVSLGKIVLLLAAGGEGWAEDERATGLASIAGIAIVFIALLSELLSRGASFPTTLALAGITTVGARVTLFKKSLTVSMHLDELMEASQASSSIGSTPSAGYNQPPAVSWKASQGNYNLQNTPASSRGESEPASQKIGEVIKMEKDKKDVQAPKEKKADDADFKEIKW